MASFRIFTSQLIVQGSATIGQVQRVFGVPLVSIKRATKLYRARGAAGCVAPRPRRAGPTLTPGKLDEGRASLAARALLAASAPVARVGRVGRLLDVMPDTIRKAIAAGHPPPPRSRLASPPRDLQRSCARLGALVLPIAATPEPATAFLTQTGELRTDISTTTARRATRQAERKSTPKKPPSRSYPRTNVGRSWVAVMGGHDGMSSRSYPRTNVGRSWGRRANTLSIRSK